MSRVVLIVALALFCFAGVASAQDVNLNWSPNNTYSVYWFEPAENAEGGLVVLLHVEQFGVTNQPGQALTIDVDPLAVLTDTGGSGNFDFLYVGDDPDGSDVYQAVIDGDLFFCCTAMSLTATVTDMTTSIETNLGASVAVRHDAASGYAITGVTPANGAILDPGASLNLFADIAKLYVTDGSGQGCGIEVRAYFTNDVGYSGGAGMFYMTDASYYSDLYYTTPGSGIFDDGAGEIEVTIEIRDLFGGFVVQEGPFTYYVSGSPVEETSWGTIKALYR